MLVIAGGILIALAILGVMGLGVAMLADNPGVGTGLVVLAACAMAYVVIF